MPRLTNGDGITVEVSDETAKALGSEWVPEKKTPSKSSK